MTGAYHILYSRDQVLENQTTNYLTFLTDFKYSWTILNIAGAAEIMMMTDTRGMIYLSGFGTTDPNTYPMSNIPHVQTNPPIILYAKKVLYLIFPIPATIGANVRIAGINLAIMIVFPPCLS